MGMGLKEASKSVALDVNKGPGCLPETFNSTAQVERE